MKTKILKFNAILLLVLLIVTSCDKEELEFDDEGIVVEAATGLSIYKTKGDYIDLVAVYLMNGGNYSGIPTYAIDGPLIKTNSSGEYIQNFRWKLKNDYVVSTSASPKHVFLDVTFDEYLRTNINVWTDERIAEKMIDENPFVEYYHQKGDGYANPPFSLGELNKMIENGTLEEAFNQIK